MEKFKIFIVGHDGNDNIGFLHTLFNVHASNIKYYKNESFNQWDVTSMYMGSLKSGHEHVIRCIGGILLFDPFLITSYDILQNAPVVHIHIYSDDGELKIIESSLTRMIAID